MKLGDILLNEDEVETRATRLHGGPMEGQAVVRPNSRVRKKQHAQAFRCSDEQQEWQPGMQGPERVKFCVYLWLTSEQRYCWVDHLVVGSERELMRVLEVVAES